MRSIFFFLWCNDRHSSAACFFPYNYLLSLYFIYVQLQIIQLDTLVVIFSIFYWWYLPYVCVSVMSISHRLLYPIALCVQLRYCPSYTYFFQQPSNNILKIIWKSKTEIYSVTVTLGKSYNITVIESELKSICILYAYLRNVCLEMTSSLIKWLYPYSIYIGNSYL